MYGRGVPVWPLNDGSAVLIADDTADQWAYNGAGLLPIRTSGLSLAGPEGWGVRLGYVLMFGIQEASMWDMRIW